ncbi:MAG: YjbQ family protein [Proteobacteria bacterium]|nr:YjbQ family protein [Pseudomonadota bacterium]
METIEIRTTSQTELVDITDRVQDVVKKLKTSDGICYVYVPHTTAGVTINENADPSVKGDIIMALDTVIATEFPYRHGEGNSPAHIKASLVGSSTSVFVESGRLVLGTWQGIFFCEFDGPRTRRVHINCL